MSTPSGTNLAIRRDVKKLILLFIFKIFVACYMGLACKQPVQLPFECLSDLQKKVHYFLCRQATQVDHGGPKNYFTAALVFYFQDNTQPSSHLQPLVLWISSRNNNTNGCFVSGQTSGSDQNTFNDLHKTLEKDFDELCTSLNTYIRRDMQKVQKDQKDFTKFRLTDSEMQFLHTITNQINTEEQLAYSHAIIQSIQNYQNLQLQRIELHGFTTRDMCPCCFQHLQNFLVQANTQQTDSKTFFGGILTQLKQQSIPISFFISSLVELGHKEYEFSRYRSYRKECKEKISIASAPSEKTMHCIFLRKNNAPLLSLKGKKTQQAKKMVISNANTIYHKSQELKTKNLNPGVEQMQLGNFKLKKDSECKTLIIVIDLKDINLGTQPVSQTPETLTIAGQQFRLHDVPKDGNCGVWAFLQERNLCDCTNPTRNMMITRQAVAALAKEGGANATTQHRISTDREWLSTDDFRYFAQYAHRDIVVIIDDGYGNYQHETYYADGKANALVNGLPAEYRPNALYIYYRNGHFQTLLLEPFPENKCIENWEDWTDSEENE